MKHLAFVIVGFAALFGAATPTNSGERALSGDEIRRALTGNSIVSPDFGCVHYVKDGVSNLFASGQVQAGTWRIDGNLYFSSGRCGDVGCQFFGEYPSFVFRRVDGSYEQPVILILGNHCERDGILS
jgi:hypothetical protein